MPTGCITGDWWMWVICWGNWANIVNCSYMVYNPNWCAWRWWQAINNMYWLIIHACCYYNYCIIAKGGTWWNWGNAYSKSWSSSSSHWEAWGCGWAWGCWANGWHVSIVYHSWSNLWTIDVSWWCWGCWWQNNCQYGCSTTYQPNWANGSAGWSKICKPF